MFYIDATPDMIYRDYLQYILVTEQPIDTIIHQPSKRVNEWIDQGKAIRERQHERSQHIMHTARYNQHHLFLSQAHTPKQPTHPNGKQQR